MLALKKNELLIFIYAWYRVVLYTICIRFIPFSRYANRLGKPSVVSDQAFTPASENTVRQIILAIRRVCHYNPWKISCFVQAITAKQLLHKQGIESTLYFGIMNPGENMKAHAWLKKGEFFITGEKNHALFTVVAFYT